MKMRRRVAEVLIPLVIFAGCFKPPSPDLLTLILVALSAQEGIPVPVKAIAQVKALIAGEEVIGVPSTPDNQIISPVTGKPCMFLTTEGLTPLGVVLVQTMLPVAGDPDE